MRVGINCGTKRLVEAGLIRPPAFSNTPMADSFWLVLLRAQRVGANPNPTWEAVIIGWFGLIPMDRNSGTKRLAEPMMILFLMFNRSWVAAISLEAGAIPVRAATGRAQISATMISGLSAWTRMARNFGTDRLVQLAETI